MTDLGTPWRGMGMVHRGIPVEMEWTYYWDMSNTAKWTGTEQQPEVGSLNLKSLDFAMDYNRTINGLQCIANIGGFASVRREFGTDLALPAISGPYCLGIVYHRQTELTTAFGNDGDMIAIAKNNVPAGDYTPGLRSGDPYFHGAPEVIYPNAICFPTKTITGTTANALDTTHVGFLLCYGSLSKLYVDGVLEAEGDLGDTNISAGHRIVWITGRDADGTGPTSGWGTTYSKAGEGGLAIGLPTEPQILSWMNQMMTKWGIP